MEQSTQDKIIELRRSGMKYKDIAKELNMSISNVAYWLDPVKHNRRNHLRRTAEKIIDTGKPIEGLTDTELLELHLFP